MTKDYAADTGAALADAPAPDAPEAPEDGARVAVIIKPNGPGTFAVIALDRITPSLTNPRKTFDAAKLQDLADSIRASGVHQPVLVRPLPGSRMEDTERTVQYELVVGERRLRASQIAGLDAIPAMIRAMGDNEVLEAQCVENLQRDDLAPLEEAEGYETLMQHAGLTSDQVAAKIGKSRSYVYARLKLLDLCQEARQALREGAMDFSKALLLARIPDTKLQIKALEYVLREDYYGDLPGYRDCAAYVQREFMLRLDSARFKITDATLVPAAGSCKACPKRTGANPDLFSDVKGADVCTDPQCYAAKEQAHADAIKRTAVERGQTIIDGREAKALMPNDWSNRVEGYLRLDDASDSPTKDPLRKLIGKAMDKAGVMPTLIANPYKDGELVAVLLPEQVAALLKAQGHEGEAATITDKSGAAARHAAEGEKAKLVDQYERDWRWGVLEAAWHKADSRRADDVSDKVLRHVASHYAQMLNADQAKRLCKLLDLGKVAPKEGMLQYVAGTDNPGNALMLLVMFRDVEYRPWMGKADTETNTGLMLVANEQGVDIEAVKAEVKKAMREAAKPPKPKAAQSDPPLAPAAPACGVRAGAKGGKRKTSPEEAQAQIAAAMQAGEGTESGADAQDIEGPVAGALAVGARVKVLPSATGPKAAMWVGKVGTITGRVGPEAWDVCFEGKTAKPVTGKNADHVTGFHASELGVLA